MSIDKSMLMLSLYHDNVVVVRESIAVSVSDMNEGVTTRRVRLSVPLSRFYPG